MNGERINKCMVELTEKLTELTNAYNEAENVDIECMVISKKYMNKLCEAGEILIKKADNLGGRFVTAYPTAKLNLRKAILSSQGLSVDIQTTPRLLINNVMKL